MFEYFDSGQGNPQIIDLTNPEPTSRTDPKFIVEDPDSKINMYLYTKNAKGTPKKIKIEKDDLRREVSLNEDYDGNKPTKVHNNILKLITKNLFLTLQILIHGWKSNSNDPVIQLIKDAYLEEMDVNVIGKSQIISTIYPVYLKSKTLAVDWKELAGENYYFKSARSTRDVGQNVAAVIDHIVNKENASINDVHVIGYLFMFIILIFM